MTSTSNGAEENMELSPVSISERDDGLEEGQSSSSSSSDEVSRSKAAANQTATNDENIVRRGLRKCLAFYHANDFPINVLLAIALAKAYPPLGAEYLRPKITATWVAVIIIFLVSGVGLRTSEFGQVIFKRIPFNIFVQVYNFGVVSSVVFGISKALLAAGILPRELTTGMIICSCLPMAVNATIVLTGAARGNEAAAIFHSAFGNIIGIFLSPLLIVAYIPGATGDTSLTDVILSLVYRVLIPLIIGQIIRLTCEPARNFYLKYKKWFKKTQEGCLVFIVYTVFCRTFNGGKSAATIGETFLMILFQLLLLLSLKVLAWYSLKLLFRNEPELRVMGLYGCVNKTVALGVPLIDSMYGSDPNAGLYILPLLIWFPMQLVVGSSYVPKLVQFVTTERERLDKLAAENEGAIINTETSSNPEQTAENPASHDHTA